MGQEAPGVGLPDCLAYLEGSSRCRGVVVDWGRGAGGTLGTLRGTRLHSCGEGGSGRRWIIRASCGDRASEKLPGREYDLTPCQEGL